MRSNGGKGARQEGTFQVLRLSADPDGESRLELGDVPLALKDFAPPATPFSVSDLTEAIGYVIIRLPPGWIGEPHPTPRRQILFCLSGAMRVTTSRGETCMVSTGDALLMEDTTGKGHTSEVTSEGPVEAVIVQVA